MQTKKQDRKKEKEKNVLLLYLYRVQQEIHNKKDIDKNTQYL